MQVTDLQGVEGGGHFGRRFIGGQIALAEQCGDTPVVQFDNRILREGLDPTRQTTGLFDDPLVEAGTLQDLHRSA
jgi:hypothetical protein